MMKTLLSLVLLSSTALTNFAFASDLDKCSKDNPSFCQEKLTKCSNDKDQACLLELSKKICTFDMITCNKLKDGFKYGDDQVVQSSDSYLSLVFDLIKEKKIAIRKRALQEELKTIVDGKEEHLFNKTSKEQILKFWTDECNLDQKLNNNGSCTKLGQIYLNGNHSLHVAVDENKAATFFERACNLSDGLACYNLANLYKLGKGVSKDQAKNIEYLEKSCNLRNFHACDTLSSIDENGLGVKVEAIKSRHLVNQAITYAQKDCPLNLADACYSLGETYLTGIDRIYKESQLAISYFKKACDLKLGSACYAVANAYLEGDGVEKDQNLYTQYLLKAHELLEKECEQNNTASCFIVADQYLDVAPFKDLPQAQDKADTLYQKSLKNLELDCSKEDSTSCFALAQQYEGLYPEETDTIYNFYQKAKDLYDKECNLGYAASCDNLGQMFELGLGVVKSADTAQTYFKKACALGYGDCNN